MPLRKVHELTFLWFGLPGPLVTQPKNNPPKYKQFAQTVCGNSAASFLLVLKGKGDSLYKIVPKLFAQTVLVFGWVVFLGGSPLHDSNHQRIESRDLKPILNTKNRKALTAIRTVFGLVIRIVRFEIVANWRRFESLRTANCKLRFKTSKSQMRRVDVRKSSNVEKKGQSS